MPPRARSKRQRDHDEDDDASDSSTESIVKTDTQVVHHDFAVGDRLDIEQAGFEARGLMIKEIKKVRCQGIARCFGAG